MRNQTQTLGAAASMVEALAEFSGFFDLWIGPAYGRPERTAVQLLLKFSDGTTRGVHWLLDELAAHLAETAESVVARGRADLTKGGPPKFVSLVDVWFAEKTALQILMRFSDNTIRGRHWRTSDIVERLRMNPATVVPDSWAIECKADLIGRLHRAPTAVGVSSSNAAAEDDAVRIGEALYGRVLRGEQVLGKAIGDARKQMRDAQARLDHLEAGVKK